MSDFITESLLSAVCGTPAEAAVRRALSRPTIAPRPVKRAACPLAARTSETVLAKEVVLPIRTSSINRTSGEHWSRRAKRANAQRTAAYMALLTQVPLPALPVVVKLTRVGKRPLDSHDNLRASLKNVVDGIADAYGVRDDDARIEWVYGEQERGDYAVKVKIQRKDGGK